MPSRTASRESPWRSGFLCCIQPAPEGVFGYDGSREGWKPAVSPEEDVYRKALELVITAIERRPLNWAGRARL